MVRKTLPMGSAMLVAAMVVACNNEVVDPQDTESQSGVPASSESGSETVVDESESGVDSASETAASSESAVEPQVECPEEGWSYRPVPKEGDGLAISVHQASVLLPDALGERWDDTFATLAGADGSALYGFLGRIASGDDDDARRYVWDYDFFSEFAGLGVELAAALQDDVLNPDLIEVGHTTASVMTFRLPPEKICEIVDSSVGDCASTPPPVRAAVWRPTEDSYYIAIQVGHGKVSPMGIGVTADRVAMWFDLAEIKSALALLAPSAYLPEVMTGAFEIAMSADANYGELSYSVPKPIDIRWTISDLFDSPADEQPITFEVAASCPYMAVGHVVGTTTADIVIRQPAMSLGLPAPVAAQMLFCDKEEYRADVYESDDGPPAESRERESEYERCVAQHDQPASFVWHPHKVIGYLDFSESRDGGHEDFVVTQAELSGSAIEFRYGSDLLLGLEMSGLKNGGVTVRSLWPNDAEGGMELAFDDEFELGITTVFGLLPDEFSDPDEWSLDERLTFAFEAYDGKYARVSASDGVNFVQSGRVVFRSSRGGHDLVAVAGECIVDFSDDDDDVVHPFAEMSAGSCPI
jgi:hypothetical protein